MPNQKNSPTHIICVLDRSGSMSSLSQEVIGSFNNFLSEQKKLKGKAFLTLVLFDDQYEVVYDRVDLKDVNPIDSSVYFTRGMTALFDAVGKTINTNIKDEKAIVLIQTDGAENSSHEYKKEIIQGLVKQQEEAGWKFVFLGANIDAASEGAAIGIAKNSTVQFEASANGVRSAYDAMSFATASYRS